MERISRASQEPIAIVGLAFQFPQGAIDEESLWEKLMNRECTSTEFPKERLNIEAFHNPDIKSQGTQRGLLETTYHAIENASIRRSDIAGSNTSVHVGSFCNDYMAFVLRDEEQIPTYNATGCSQTLLSNRISWGFDLRGTSLTIDTASSTAICAASNVIFSPENLITLSNMNFLSPDGKCFSFDHRENGYARGEGFASLILKPLSKAIEDGDTIRSLIRSTRSNQDGHTTGGITQPSKGAQKNLIAETYQVAGLDLRETRLFEGHGTGTAVGDPIEAAAIGETFRRFRSDNDSLFV
ncbi:beta-ketoacyl synthase [Lindgomyces ingoldianus]|uniref:Beta-ketoacyl synthase n=1 Tax=Lindgomyces ingoldianus TaxID=673940 RepID=A0ACB6QXS5_9PLEO|nr:beta-ketoacyl synthase [Lindgomyces ingoldianus]KAF2470885.1 beta-ketoacyl synthase [Lindgomyces ingoldianus]